MATFNDVLQEFKSRLDRDDCSDDLAAYFIADAQRVAQRDLRLPSMERSRLIICQGETMPWVTVPDDLLEVIDIFSGHPNGPAHPLERRSFRQISALPLVGQPRVYARLGPAFHFRGVPTKDDNVNLVYYGTVTNFTDATSTNELSIACPDVLVYGALMFAADHFDHPSAQRWEQTYEQLVQQVQGSAVGLENTGGPAVIQPICRWD